MPRLADAIIPLFHRGDDELPEQYGSGTLLTFGGVGFLATAAHCLDSLTEQGVFVPAGGKIEGVDAPGFRCADPFDLGYLRLSNELAHALAAKAYFLTPAHLDADDQFHADAHYVFVGFPWRQSRRLVGPKRFLQKTHSFTGKTLDRLTMLAEGINPGVNIAVSFDRNHVRAPDGSDQTMPMPQGMSGGGIFNARRTPNSKRPVGMRLAGLGTFEGPRWLQGVRIAALLHLIRENNPDVAGAVPVSRRYAFNRPNPAAAGPAKT